MNPSNQDPNQILEFCTLEYRSSKTGGLSGESGRLIATVGRDLLNGLTIRIEPGWQGIVDLEDAPEVEEFLSDLSSRSVEDPDALWAQLIQINWGLVVTGTVHHAQVIKRIVEESPRTEQLLGRSPQSTH